ncbi:rRNA maturation RNase YbeY [Candidatus Daviesbacteria bacterium RIFCSPLOWO2_01_FULL_43_38]|uniref:rRNA maturation RNase YbeY n=3 Tax=Candidatus Daviesiibacteriota TaxID=1752718 RepID=A0A1F5K7B4_9BACT|nr:MAG: putative rRNA maturation factor [Candidatus Daviesbacteria bacterium GW2011_GWA1_42_6]KKS70756.1 MAG: putative rRNA maturation factor [Candidatus Daviesbacteria bacterium GW2011_GWA2_42_7]OGE20328.1 MAG: rRNA maturation RNase YbeY [Candidatus Daviesbacteria bacterium RIFCSPHIGHO2_01_FULL_43_17]OGE36822.1 MAG: rRNA maturation RNase YbeY [Candidatus Daviesbacteria bacterium RIFCSPHIGHO2_12_FULL_43_11]OGE64047.1 MAG: rRNA maturation RNase YbeY [Candidatus Daviesbacteria bacterium RIFCSPLOW
MVNVIVSSDPRYSINRNAVQAAVLNVLKKNRVTSKVELEVNIVGDRKMHELNKQYRGIDSTTDILSFVLEDPNPSNLQHVPRMGFVAAPDNVLRLGSIVIAYPQAVEDASLDGISVEDEICFLVDHGTNHLLGIHHNPH